MFNKKETFNRDLETLKDDILKIHLGELSQILKECTILEELEEKTQVQLAQEELDEIRNLEEDKIQVYKTLLETNETLLETNKTLN